MKGKLLESIIRKAVNEEMEKMSMPDIIMTIGISGCGKSTWTKTMEGSGYTVVCPDDIRREVTGSISDQSGNAQVFTIVDQRIQDILKNGGKVIYDATNLNTRFRRDFLKKYSNYRIACKVFKSDPKISKERIRKDLLNNVDRSNVPDHVIDRQYEMYLKALNDIKKEPFCDFL